MQLFFSGTLLILRTIRRGIINAHRSSCKVPARYSCHILMKLKFSPHIFEKYSNITVERDSPVGIVTRYGLESNKA